MSLAVQTYHIRIMTTYLDYNATSPVLPEVADFVYQLMTEEYGNAGSRTHVFGAKAKAYVEAARGQVAQIVDADKSEVIFTSGATESNNIAILGLKEYALKNNKKHIVTTAIEHKAVLEPIEHLAEDGFEVTYVSPGPSGLISAQDIYSALRDDTILVSVMHVNNETGCIQSISEICELLKDHPAYFHVDAAQSFGKISEALCNKRIDFISASGHKLYAPKGIGALIMRKRGFMKAPLKPLLYGGGQEKGLRPGTLPVQLIAGFGLACQLAEKHATEWIQHCSKIKKQMISLVSDLNGNIIGSDTSPFVINFYIPGVNSEAAMVLMKESIAISNGSACTSSSYKPSHVLTAMGLSDDAVAGSLRISWSHMIKDLPVDAIRNSLLKLM
ncbi:cysteine desulfurase DndA [Alteromonas sp. MmMcT2-2]|mgnify:FL=1|jgi:cysteine desulfurase|uniref:cysteine desulfurase DndA n=1 Tax=Alteromonas sp. MmMcT2-2 TaxID=2917732 RepID=UPI001EF3266C|nr:cysteine desulfurase DndA [Alteromonas sp. MmMcT2-2]MCG7642446.1 cysteine desulfurase DndA [Alteromonas sp. MmMcT2-2]|tara:strand:- start:398 stop:1558 length:1161 start_codon:yes stop_codon:yes gene_type:complete